MSIPKVERQRMLLDELKPAPYNPRTITEDALEGLTESLRRYGNVQELVWNKRSGHLVGGHQRLHILKEEGETEADVAVVDLDEAEERALCLALNNPAIQGDFTASVELVVRDVVARIPDIAPLRLDEIDIPDVSVTPPKREEIKPPRTTVRTYICPQCGHEWEE